MKRKDFIKTVGITGAAAALPFSGLSARRIIESGGTCNLIPSETAGPFPLDLTDNTFFFRQDVREDREGAAFNLKMRIIGQENCEPMANVRVNIWHCDADGNYSGYGSEEGQTYLRGYQMTDANGEVDFITVFPGWYPGRVCHIHFQVYVNSNYAAISQMTFDHDMVNQVYEENPVLYPAGDDPLTPDSDGIFNDGYELQLADVAVSSTEGEYDGFIEVTVLGSGTTGISHREMQTDKQIILGQNHPNPFQSETTIPFKLKSTSEVSLQIWSPEGRMLRTIELGQLTAGNHEYQLDFSRQNLTPASYLYQIVATNEAGKFTTVKRMTCTTR